MKKLVVCVLVICMLFSMFSVAIAQGNAENDMQTAEGMLGSMKHERVMDFDKKTDFKIRKESVNTAYSSEYDYRIGGSAGAKFAIGLSSEEDHTSGSGNLLKSKTPLWGAEELNFLILFRTAK